MWCPNQNFGDPHGCLVGKYKPFGKKMSFLAWLYNYIALYEKSAFRFNFGPLEVTRLGPSPQSSTTCQQTFPQYVRMIAITTYLYGAEESDGGKKEDQENLCTVAQLKE